MAENSDTLRISKLTYDLHNTLATFLAELLSNKKII